MRTVGDCESITDGILDGFLLKNSLGGYDLLGNDDRTTDGISLLINVGDDDSMVEGKALVKTLGEDDNLFVGELLGESLTENDGVLLKTSLGCNVGTGDGKLLMILGNELLTGEGMLLNT